MTTPWRAGRLDGRGSGPRLVFGRMHEDWTVEARAFSGRRRILCIASAGCTALALAARGHEVHAVDVNPAQIEYVRARLGGEPEHEGSADRLLRWARRAAPLAGLPRDLVDRFLRMRDPAQQEALWVSRIDRGRLRLALAAATAPPLLRAFYAPGFVHAVPGRFGDLLLDRLRRGVSRHPNHVNPYLWSLLRGTGAPGADPPPRGELAALEVADAADYLDASAPSSFDGFSLSNVVDGAAAADRARLQAAVRRAARPGAVAVVRSFGQPRDPVGAGWAVEDRSMLWGVVHVGQAANLLLAEAA